MAEIEADEQSEIYETLDVITKNDQKLA